MRRYSTLFIGLVSIIPSLIFTKRDSEDTEHTGRSHLFVRPLFQSASPEMLTNFRDQQIHAKENGRHAAFQAVVFGSKTTSDDDLAAYFTPCGKARLRVSDEDQREIVGDFDLLGQHFGFFGPSGSSASSSSIRFAPTHSEIGVGLHYRHSFWHNEEKDRGFFFSASFPIVRVKNNMNLREPNLEANGAPVKTFIDGDGATVEASEVKQTVGSMREAFNQSSWCFGKVTCNEDKMTKTGVADIEVKLGYEWLQHEPYHVESYLGILIPTGTKVRSEYLFEPIVGHGKHFGLMWGSTFGMQIWEDEENDRTIRLELTNHSLYLLKKEQTRSIDLKNNPWSRYMDVYTSKEQAQEAFDLGGTAGAVFATPGINVFTQAVDVKPGLSHDINTGFVFDSGKFRLEAGYNFYARSSEIVEICKFPEGIALKAANGLGITQPLRRIDATTEDCPTVALADYEQSIIKETDLDLSSAASPSLISNTVYFVIGYHCEEREYPLFGNIGASYEFTESTKAVPQRWVTWAKIGVSF